MSDINSVNYIRLRECEIKRIDLNQFKEIVKLYFKYKEEYVLYVGIYKDKMSCIEKSREKIIEDIVSKESCSSFIKEEVVWRL